MPDGNGAEFISTGDPRVDAAFRRLQERNEARFNDLEDAVLVQAHLEKRASERIKEHAELIAGHHGKIYDHELLLQRIETGLAEASRDMHR